jgi:hypothetical protein
MSVNQPTPQAKAVSPRPDSTSAERLVRVTLELPADLAAALARFSDKVTHVEARAVLYPHVSAQIRSDQAHQIIAAFHELERSLQDAGVRGWPWVETGSAEVA